MITFILILGVALCVLILREVGFHVSQRNWFDVQK